MGNDCCCFATWTGTSSVRAPGQRPGLKGVQPMSAEIVLAIVVLFFSGVWSAIKFVDEQTDNKWVFLVPAGVLSLFLLSGIGEGYVFLACLFALGPIVVMLIIVGLDQGGQKSSFYTSSGSRRGSRKRDLYRKLAPSDIRAYDRLIGYALSDWGDEIYSREDGIIRLNELGVGDAERFFSSPYVIKTLGLPQQPKSHDSGGGSLDGEIDESVDYSEIEGDDWWEKGYEGGEEKPSLETRQSDESCGDPNCSNPVTAFDFRCFTCRKRFCRDHAGANIECRECTK